MKKMNRLIAALLCMCILACTLTGCGNSEEKEIKKTIESFQESYNSLDIRGMISCMEPDIQDTANATIDFMMVILNVATDIELNREQFYSIIEALPILYEFLGEDVEAEMGEIRIDVKDISITDENAVVTAEISYSHSENIEEGHLYLIKLDGYWYLSVDNFY